MATQSSAPVSIPWKTPRTRSVGSGLHAHAHTHSNLPCTQQGEAASSQQPFGGQQGGPAAHAGARVGVLAHKASDACGPGQSHPHPAMGTGSAPAAPRGMLGAALEARMQQQKQQALLSSALLPDLQPLQAAAGSPGAEPSPAPRRPSASGPSALILPGTLSPSPTLSEREVSQGGSGPGGQSMGGRQQQQQGMGSAATSCGTTQALPVTRAMSGGGPRFPLSASPSLPFAFTPHSHSLAAIAVSPFLSVSQTVSLSKGHGLAVWQAIIRCRVGGITRLGTGKLLFVGIAAALCVTWLVAQCP